MKPETMAARDRAQRAQRLATATTTVSATVRVTMGKVFISLVFALGAAAVHAAGLAITNPGSLLTASGLNSISGFSGQQTATFGTLSATVAGTVTYTYLGSEAGFTNGFGTASTSFSSLLNQNAIYNGLKPSQVGSSFSTGVDAGQLNFGFATVYPSSYVGTVSNGQTYSASSVASFAIVSGGVVNGNSYDFFLAYNDPFPGAADYNDMVIGVSFISAVPEPKDYALLLTGLLFMGIAVRFQRNRATPAS